MNIRILLQQLAAYYEATSGAGHTQAMIHGAENTPAAIVLAIGLRHAADLQQTAGLEQAHVVPLPFVPEALLSDPPAPLLLDNAVLRFVCDQAARRIAELEGEVARLDERLLRRYNADISRLSLAAPEPPAQRADG